MNGGRGSSPLLAAALLLLVAVIGVLTGVVLDRTVLRHDREERGWGPPAGLHRPPNLQFRRHVRERIEARIADDLDLSASQREQLSVVLQRQEERLAGVMAETRPRLDQILVETRQQVHEILTPEQRERFEARWRPGRRPPMLRLDRDPPPHDSIQ